MRKLWLAVAVLVSFAASSFAAITSMSISTVTASISFSGTGTVAFSLDMVNPGAGNTIAWTGVTPGVTAWKAADTYFVFHSTMTDSRGAVRIYTDNKASDAPHQYTGIDDPTGLVGYDAADATASSTTLKMCWRVAHATKSPIILESATNHLYDSAEGSGYFCYLWMQDINKTAFDNSYAVVKDQALGIQHGEATWGLTASPDYIYLGAKFSNAVTPRAYFGNVRVEAFVE